MSKTHNADASAHWLGMPGLPPTSRAGLVPLPSTAFTRAAVTALTEAVGFASSRYFVTLYTKRFGRRPADYQG